MSGKTKAYADRTRPDGTGNALPSSNGDIGLRLKSVIREIGLDASVESTGKSGRTLDRYVSGEVDPPLSVIRGLAERSGYSINWIATGAGPEKDNGPNVNALVLGTQVGTLPASVITDFAFIPRLDIKASAGNGNLAIDEEVIDFLAFQASWLRARNVNPEKARVMTAKGDSMEPTIRDGDVLLVDTSIDRVRDNALYIIVFEGLVFVKRIHVKMNGSILLLSDNERYPPEEITQDAAPRLHVAGRVVWFGRSI